VRIVEAARARYDGTKQNPWNDIECGDHYVRAMSSWALLEAASGFDYDAANASLAFAPVLTPHDYRAPFVTRDGWGTFRQRDEAGNREVSIEAAWGHLELRQLRLASGRVAQSADVTLDGKKVPEGMTQDGSQVTIEFSETVTIGTGEAIAIRL
jgi:non-lysosomal glucosylceramidase